MKIKEAIDGRSSCFVPVLSSDAGSALTVADWASIGVKTASYYLTTLLMKPGFTLLSQLTSLASYVAWQGCLVLNAADLTMDSAGTYVVRSPYDGSTHRYTVEQIFQLIDTLNPDVLILPRAAPFHVWSRLSSSIKVYVWAEDVTSMPSIERLAGVYITALAQRAACQPLTCYASLQGEHGCMPALVVEEGIDWIETNRPAEDALDGVVYCPEGAIDMSDPAMEMSFESLDPACVCPTCETALTRAYLHHLYQQTPGLCQRFLLLHNAYQAFLMCMLTQVGVDVTSHAPSE